MAVCTSAIDRVCPHRRDSYMLNERRVILSLLHATLAIYATFEHVSVGRSRVQFDDGRAVRAALHCIECSS